MRPRILAVTAGALEKRNSMCAALVNVCGAELLPGKTYPENRVSRGLSKMGLHEYFGAHAANIRHVNSAILAREFDILFIVKGNLVTANTLKALKTRPNPPKIIGWSPDDIFLSHNNSTVLKAAAPFYDTFYTAKSLNITQGELKQMGFVDARYLHQGYDSDLHRPVPDPSSRFAGLVTFVGFGEQDRFDHLNHLAKSGVPVQVWGNGWTRAMRAAAHENLIIHDHGLFGGDYADALCNSAISLCFLRKLNRDRHTSRTFEIPACGGFMLAERTEEHRQFFAEDAEAVFFDGADELLQKTRYYLNNPQERRGIAASGRERCLKSGYSYEHLAHEIIRAAR